MSASKEAKKHGFKSAIELCEVANVKRSTIYAWHRNNKKLFEAVLIGAAEIKRSHSSK